MESTIEIKDITISIITRKTTTDIDTTTDAPITMVTEVITTTHLEDTVVQDTSL